MNSRQTNLNQTQPTNKKENITVEIPYVGKQSHIFAKDISKLIWKFSAMHLTPIYKTCKVGNYFYLKSNTPALLLSNVVYRFSCPCDAGLTSGPFPLRAWKKAFFVCFIDFFCARFNFNRSLQSKINKRDKECSFPHS